MKRITIVNGPNLNLLGKREPEVYGLEDFDSYFQGLKERHPDIHWAYAQNNVEGEIINILQQAAQSSDGIILNAAGYSHTSVAIADCVAAIGVPVVEVHISNIYAREEFRHHTLLSGKCAGCICGMGLEGYELAVLFFKNYA